MNVKFYIDGPKEPKTIYLKIHSLSIKISTKQKVKTPQWDKKKQRGKSLYTLNQLLDTLEKIAITATQQNILDNISTTKTNITQAIAQETGLYKKTKEITTFYTFSLNIIDTSNWSQGYTNQFSSWLNIFNKRYPNITFDRFNYQWYRTYKNEGLTNYKINTFSGHWKKLKRVLDDAHYGGIKVDQSYRKIKVASEPSFKVYLTTEEVDTWYQSLPSLTGPHYNASVLFLIGCFSGMRYSDFKSIKCNTIYIESEVYYRITTEKTKTSVTIPGNESLNHLLTIDAHEISNQKMNKYLKESAQTIGIDTPIHINDDTIPKYDLIQTHTARRTFATNAYIQGIPINFIMSITGHKTEKEFRKYIKIDDLKSAIQFNKFKNVK